MADGPETTTGDQQVLPGVDPAPVVETKPKVTQPVLDKKTIDKLRKEWEGELHAKTGGKPIDEIIEAHKALEAEKIKAAEAAKSELERVVGRAEKAEKLHATEASRARELESAVRMHKLTDAVREIADSATLRQPHYKKLLLRELLDRAELSKDGSTVVYKDEKGNVSEELDGPTVLQQVLARYPDLTGTNGPGYGGGSGVTVPSGGRTTTGNQRGGTPRVTKDEEQAIFAGLLTQKRN